jgi:hypothetical protein
LKSTTFFGFVTEGLVQQLAIVESGLMEDCFIWQISDNPKIIAFIA